MTYEIWWDDLTTEAKERLADLWDGNINIAPLSIIEREADVFRYIPVSPDGFPYTPEDFATEQEAWDYIKELVPARYGHQGYYSMGNRERITLDQAIAMSRVTSYNTEE